MPKSCHGEWRVDIHRRARRYLRRNPSLRERVDSIVEELKINPYMAADKVLQQCGGRLSRRIGDYRIIYSVDPRRRIVSIECIGPREKVYEECC